MDNIDVQKLAELARVHMTDEEAVALEHDMQGIIALCAQVQEAVAEPATRLGVSYNVLREDEEPHEGGAHTDALLVHTKEGYLEVRKIISQD